MNTEQKQNLGTEKTDTPGNHHWKYHHFNHEQVRKKQHFFWIDCLHWVLVVFADIHTRSISQIRQPKKWLISGYETPFNLIARRTKLHENQRKKEEKTKKNGEKKTSADTVCGNEANYTCLNTISQVVL